MAKSTRKDAPAMTPEAQERKMINLAMKAAEKKLKDGTASSQVIVHFLKLGTANAELEREKLAAETELARAKVMAMEASAHFDEVYTKAIEAMQNYSVAFRNAPPAEEEGYDYFED